MSDEPLHREALQRTADVVDLLDTLGVEVDYIDQVVEGGDGRAARVSLTLTIPRDSMTEVADVVPDFDICTSCGNSSEDGQCPNCDGQTGDDKPGSGLSTGTGTGSLAEEAVGDGGAVPEDSGGESGPTSSPTPRTLDPDTTESAVRERDEDQIEPVDDGNPEDVPEGRPLPAGKDLDHKDPDHLRWAYEHYDVLSDAAEEFSVAYTTFYAALRRREIHSPQDGALSDDEDEEDVDEATGPTPEPRSVDWDALEPAVTDHDGELLDGDPEPEPGPEEVPWPYRKLDESSMPARVGLPEVLEAVEEVGAGELAVYVAAELGVDDEEAKDALWLLGLKQKSSWLLEEPEFSEQLAEIREEVAD